MWQHTIGQEILRYVIYIAAFWHFLYLSPGIFLHVMVGTWLNLITSYVSYNP
jgi:hypothetical protein